MVRTIFRPNFKKQVSKIRDQFLKSRLKKQITKITENPEIGKPMRHMRKGTREVYIKPFRLSYNYTKKIGVITFLDLYHKDEQ